jgi:hypothetical protein
MKKKLTLVISVTGGVVQDVYVKGFRKDFGVRVIVADFDNLEAGDQLCHEIATAPFSEADDLIREDPLFKP